MRISQKCYYALRALFALAQQEGDTPLTIAVIGERQSVPALFLQTILRELKQGGFVESRRGKEGGYWLAKPARKITVGEVVRFVQGDLAPVDCLSDDGRRPDAADIPFLWFWEAVRQQMDTVFDGVTIADFVERERSRLAGGGADYVI